MFRPLPNPISRTRPVRPAQTSACEVHRWPSCRRHRGRSCAGPRARSQNPTAPVYRADRLQRIRRPTVRSGHERAPGDGHRGGVRHLRPGATPLPTRCSRPRRSSTPTPRRREGPACTLGLRGGVAAAGRPRLRPVAAGRRPAQLTDEDLGLANVILTNGARLYVDHAHPEYSTPEVTNPRDVVLWDKAGEQVMLTRAARPALPGSPPIVLYKNNADNKGACYGAHENYLMRRHPVRRHRAPPDPVLRQPPGLLRRRPGGHRPGRPRARLPDQPARRLLRGRGRARDHAQAPDRQHPRRAARRPGEVPAAARDHR